MRLLHNLLSFIWKNLIIICIMIWMLWVSLSLLEYKERLDRLEKDNIMIKETMMDVQKGLYESIH